MREVIGLIVTPEGLPLAYEVLAGNTSDKTTLGDFLTKSRRNTARPTASGSWIAHSNRRDAGANARFVATGELSRWHAEGTADAA